MKTNRFQVLKKRCSTWIKQLGILKEFKPILKLSHIVHCKRTEYEICVIQVVGKNSFAELDPQYLLENPRVLKAFSHEDVVVITKLAEKIKNSLTQEKYKIREINTHDPKLRDIVLIEKNFGSQRLQEISLKQIEHDTEFLNKFKPDEAFRLGHIKGVNDVEEDQEIIATIKKLTKKSIILEFKKYLP
jgi:hypothetical protein